MAKSSIRKRMKEFVNFFHNYRVATLSPIEYKSSNCQNHLSDIFITKNNPFNFGSTINISITSYDFLKDLFIQIETPFLLFFF